MMAAVTIAAPPVGADLELAAVDEARFAEVWDGTMLRTMAALRDAFVTLSSSGGGRVTVELPGGSSAVAMAVAEGMRLLVMSAAMAWAEHGIEVEVECIPPST